MVRSRRPWLSPLIAFLFATVVAGCAPRTTRPVARDDRDAVRAAVVTFQYPEAPRVGARDIVYDTRRQRLYAIHPAAGVISVIDIAGMRALPALEVAEWPSALDLSLSGDSLLVTHAISRHISVFSAVSRRPLGEVRLSVLDTAAVRDGNDPPMLSAMRVAANGKVLVHLHTATASGARTVEIDLRTGTQRLRSDAPPTRGSSGEWWRRLEATPDRRRIAIIDAACPHWYDADADRFSPCGAARVRGYPWAVTFDARAHRLAVGTAILDRDLSQLGEIEGGNATMLPDGDHALVLSGGAVAKVRAVEGRVIWSMPLAIQAQRLMLLPGGRSVLAIGEQSVERLELPDR